MNKLELIALAALSACASVPTYEASKDGRPLAVDSVDFSPLARSQVGYLYTSITAVSNLETAGCFHGTVRNRVAKIDKVALPIALAPFKDSVYFACDTRDINYVGFWHSHPRGSPCRFSQTDVDMFRKERRAAIAGVACEEGVSIYRK